MKNAGLFYTGVLVCILLIVFFTANYFFSKQGDVCFSNNCFKVEIAKSPIELAKGLMFRKNLDQNKGMLFVFEKEANYPFWMRDTLIPLDIIWINADNKIVFISENNLPCKDSDCPQINPNQGAKYVLEINAGLSQKFGLKVGDSVVIN